MTPSCNTCGAKFPGKVTCKSCGADPSASPSPTVRAARAVEAMKVKVAAQDLTPLQKRRALKHHTRSILNNRPKAKKHGRHV